MHKKIKARFISSALILGSFAGLAALMATNFRDNLVFFLTPTELVEKKQLPKQRIRLGGLVKTNSLQIDSVQDYRLRFTVTDYTHDVHVLYQGFLPDLFREGQGVVAEGYYDPASNQFKASKLLAKHDETYKPPVLSNKRLKDSAGRLNPKKTENRGGLQNAIPVVVDASQTAERSHDQ